MYIRLYFLFVGIYLTCTMAITTMAMVATVFVLNLYGMKEKPLPKWAKTVFISYMAKFLCMCNCASPQNLHVVGDTESNMPSAENRARSRSRAESRASFLFRRSPQLTTVWFHYDPNPRILEFTGEA